MSSDAGTPRSKKTSRAKASKTKTAGERLKCSLLLSKENDLRLTVLASLRSTDRSTLLNVILDDALRGVVVSLRGQLATEQTEQGAGEGAPEESDAEAS